MFDRFKQRSLELERLDTGDYTAAEYELWHREMRLIHRAFGEMRALRNSLFRDLAGRNGRVSILDVGAGSGELLGQLKKWLGDRASLTGVEINAAAAGSIRGSGFMAVMADGLKLPFETEAFDAVFCSLTLHHLGDEDASQLLAEMARVSRGRIYAIDLNRDPVAYYFYKTVGRFFLQRLTLDDGALSILRSFTAEELLNVAERAGLRDVKVERSRVNRLVLSGRK